MAAPPPPQRCRVVVEHVTTIYHWPHGWGAYSIALTIFACIFLGVMTVWLWYQARPCDTCGEYRAGCRCKSRVY